MKMDDIVNYSTLTADELLKKFRQAKAELDEIVARELAAVKELEGWSCSVCGRHPVVEDTQKVRVCWCIFNELRKPDCTGMEEIWTWGLDLCFVVHGIQITTLDSAR